MIKMALEQAIQTIKDAKERKIAEIKDRTMREKIIPYNADVDSARTKALTEIDNELNAKIVELKQAYETKKQELVRLGEENKKANADSVLASELAVLSVEYDAHIAKLTAQLEDIKE